MSAFLRLVALAQAPVDLAGLAVFRVVFGAIMLVDLARFVAAGWVDAYFVEPALLLTYPGFDWVTPLPRVGMFLLFGGLMLAALAVALGVAYRVAAWVLVVGHGYVFLLSATEYLNHAYLLQLVAVLLACMPAADGLSIQAARAGGRRRGWVPAWAPWILKAQLCIVYVYGGLAKIDADWLAGEPVRGWLAARARTVPEWLAGPLSSEAMVAFVVQGGLWFDLLVVPALLWRRTRVLAVIASLGFHLSNAYLFEIGVFPWFMLGATTLFFDPSWPRRLPWVGRRIDAWLGPASTDESAPARPWVAPVLVGTWLLVQLLVPLRHHLYPGPVAWTEEGHYLSWRMKLRSKTGSARFVVYAPQTRESWVVDPAEELGERVAKKLVSKPDLVLQYAHHLAERWEQERGLAVEVRAQVNVSLNGRPRRALVDPTVDLAAVEVSMWPATWIMPAPTDAARSPVGRR